jgi:curli production assembly/transport component CsgG
MTYTFINKRNLQIPLLILCACVQVSCSPFFYQPLEKTRNAELGPESPIKNTLLQLPAPKEPVVVAVYKFRDQTGQYKPSNSGASWSTAVTQGATNILIRALEESGWFVPIERENISNLLNERKIIRSSREQYEGTNSVALPPLLFAGVLLEGGIVSYETNVFTGGAGIRYFGTDASSQYREDRVSIYLRAISTSNGKILKTIYTTKSILSQEVTAGVFRYVKYKRLLEAEVGYTYNEPTEMAITEAVEKAVLGLIVEGIEENLWKLKDETELTNQAIQDYQKEKKNRLKFDALGRPFENKLRGKFFNSLSATGQFYSGDYSSSTIQPGGNLSFGFGIKKSFFWETNFGYQYIEIKDLMKSREYAADMNLLFLTNPHGKFSPFVSLGAGCLFDYKNEVGLATKEYIPYAKISAGSEYLFTNWFAIVGKASVKNLFTDYYDGVKTGSYNDFIWNFSLGIKFYW